MFKRLIPNTLRHYHSWPRVQSRLRKDAAVERRIQTMVAGMSLNEKVGQITQPEIHSIIPDEVRQYYIGSVFSHAGSWPGLDKHASLVDWLELADENWAASMATDARVKIPVMWGIDAVHGSGSVFGATLFPHNIGLGAAREPNLIRRIGAATAKQLRVTGQDWVFAPTVAVVRNIRWGRTYEGFSERPCITSVYAQKAIEGLQDSERRNKFDRSRLGPRGVIATAKHFIGDGATEFGRDQGINKCSVSDMINIHAHGYFGAIAAGAQAVMASYNSWTNETHGITVGKLHGSKSMLTTVLKEEIGFDGLIVSDSNGIGQVPGCTNYRCAVAVNAGIDVFMVPHDWKLFIENTIDMVHRGEIAMSRIDDAVTRVLRVKFRAGLFDKPKPSERRYAGDSSRLVHRALAREAVQKSLVLLKNDNNVLPLSRNQRVLVVGQNADSLPGQTGGWSLTWQGTGNTNADFPTGTTILAGIREAVGDINVTFSEDGNGIDVTTFNAVIAVIGETPYAEGLGDINRNHTLEHCTRYPEDLAVLNKVSGKGVSIITIFISGRPLFINKELNRSDAFIAAWLPGTEGAGVADVIFCNASGEINKDFHGKLSYSWPRTASQPTLHYGDPSYDPLFAYGYGLTYKDKQNLSTLDEESTTGDSDQTGNNDIATKDLEIHVGACLPPYKLFLGSPTNWGLLLDDDLIGPIASSDGNVIAQRTDVGSPHDGWKVTWTGRGAGQTYLNSRPASDLCGYLNANSALVFDAIVSQAPLGVVKMRVDCVWPCFGELDVTRLFRSVSVNARTTIKIPLKYFSARGTDFSSVDAVFLIYTESEFVLSIANIRWMTNAGKDDDAIAYEIFLP